MNKAKRKLARSPRRRLGRKRRGVLLIIVLSLLVMFALIAFTFVLVAGHYNRAATAHTRVGLTDEQGEYLVEQAFYDLLRGSNNLRSDINDLDTTVTPATIVQSHCLLEDIYGTQGVGGTLSGNATASGDTIIFDVNKTVGTWSSVRDFYAGRVITITTGPGALLSTRIVNSTDNGATTTIVARAISTPAGGTVLPQNTSEFIINGAPFSGTDAFGQNESWDAPDWANPFLSYIPTGSSDPLEIIPAFLDRAMIDTDSPADGVPNRRYDPSADSALRPLPRVVDNDRNGVLDGVWINPGFEMKTAADGRRYIPLVSYLCLDQDGRMNVNAHASELQPTTSANMLGIGAGPADVQLSQLSWLYTTADDWRDIVRTRYGSESPNAVPGGSGADAETAKTLYQGPNPYDTGTHRYASPLDLEGTGQVAVDAEGVPTFASMLTGTIVDCPYESNYVRPNGTDAPYTAAELERVLRWWDNDARSLPSRLADVLQVDPATATAADIRALQGMLATHSYSLPVPNWPGGSFAAFVRDANRDGVIDSSDNPTLTDAQVTDMFPGSLIAGGKMDLNRAWNVTNAANARAARQLFAKHLYCLMMFSLDRTYNGTEWRIDYRIPVDPALETLTADEQYELTVQRIAQWAVNVVDFRDPDSIMTPFEYDRNPFDGWDTLAEGTVDPMTEVATASLLETDGSTALATVKTYNAVGDRRLVWGSEFPDLIITEVLALHDRRVKDTNWDDLADATNEEPPASGDSPNRGTKRVYAKHDGTGEDTAKNGDKDPDQFRIPLGSLFVELSCRRNSRSTAGDYNAVLPTELYTSGVLDLNKLDPSGRPVWRIAISAPHHAKADGIVKTHNAAVAADTRQNLSPFNRRSSHPYSVAFQPEHMSRLPIYSGTAADSQLKFLDIERYIFLASGATVPGPVVADRTLPSTTNTFKATTAATIAPGGHLVVAPRASTDLASNTTTDVNSTAQTAAGNPIDLSTVTHVLAEGTTTAPDMVQVGVNISEPLLDNHYERPTKGNDQYDDGQTAVDGTEMGDFPDVPLDSEPGAPLKQSELLETDTQSNYKTAFLQRLADPTQNYDEVSNPYITIDWMPIDLTTYNGEEDAETNYGWSTNYQTAVGDFDPDDPDFKNFAVGNVNGARERGVASGTNHWAQLWTQLDWDANTGAHFPHKPLYSLGTLNSNLAGAFPWMVWLNRPFVSHFDLLLVPHTGADLLLPSCTFAGYPYGHLMDFVSESHSTPSGVSPAATYPLALYRMFEFVEVPSRFAGTRLWTDPLTPVSTSVPLAKVPHFRDPGLININTIPGQRVYDALTQGQYATWTDFSNRRLGNDSDTNGTSEGDALGRFLNPVRGTWSTSNTSQSTGSLLAGGPVDPSGTPYDANPLLGTMYDSTNAKHPWLYYQRLLRLGNMVTNKSNVFTIWITVGYFEVDDSGNIIRELGSDTGEIKRHRGFFVVDRSIPVAYQRGRNHNVDNAVLLRRMID